MDRFINIALALGLSFFVTTTGLAATPSDPYHITRIEWLAMKVNVHFLSMNGNKKGMECTAQEAAVACPLIGMDQQERQKTKQILERVFERETKAMDLAGKVSLKFI